MQPLIEISQESAVLQSCVATQRPGLSPRVVSPPVHTPRASVPAGMFLRSPIRKTLDELKAYPPLLYYVLLHIVRIISQSLGLVPDHHPLSTSLPRLAFSFWTSNVPTSACLGSSFLYPFMPLPGGPCYRPFFIPMSSPGGDVLCAGGASIAKAKTPWTGPASRLPISFSTPLRGVKTLYGDQGFPSL
jgi:hypothetical protein